MCVTLNKMSFKIDNCNQYQSLLQMICEFSLKMVLVLLYLHTQLLINPTPSFKETDLVGII